MAAEGEKQWKGDEANYCTVELTSGRLLTIEATPAEFKEMIRRNGPSSTWIDIEIKSFRPSKRDRLYRNPITVRVSEIQAIYPLDEIPREW